MPSPELRLDPECIGEAGTKPVPNASKESGTEENCDSGAVPKETELLQAGLFSISLIRSCIIKLSVMESLSRL